MKFGVLKDIKNGEYRVVCTPAEVSAIAADGHEVFVAAGAGYMAGFDDAEYESAGAKTVNTNEEIWAECDFVTKVKEIEPSEFGLLRDIQSKYNGRLNTIISNHYNLAAEFPQTDLFINSVRWPKNATEFMVDREMVRSMRRGSVVVDISNDYGCIETFRETTHDDPIYIEEDVVHYCVSNMPGAIAGSTSISYAASLLPHFRSIMNKGIAKACAADGFLRRGLTTYNGYLTHEETSGIQGRPWIQPELILGIEGEELDPAPRATQTRSNNFYK